MPATFTVMPAFAVGAKLKIQSLAASGTYSPWVYVAQIVWRKDNAGERISYIVTTHTEPSDEMEIEEADLIDPGGA